MKRLPVTYEGETAYDILIDDGALFDALELSSFSGRKALIVTDDQVAPLYADALKSRLYAFTDQVFCFVLPAGEENKTLDQVRKVYAYLIERGFDRRDFLLALGGGVIGDLTGFVAATYLRGVKFVQIPTTLLAQTDSSIGGKTGVDFDGYKNMVGAFHMPSLVYTHPRFLKTLSERQFASGMAEVLKHGLIKDAAYWERLLRARDAVVQKDETVLADVVAGSCEIKRDVVERDPHEKGERALLNFGHTIGHAIEKAYEFKLLHGECVSLGCVAAAYLSLKRGLIDDKAYEAIRAALSDYGLPIERDDLPDADRILLLTKSDKKMDAGQIRFVLLRAIGDAFVDTTATDAEITEAIATLRKRRA